jgi:anti-anti-sigma factor
LILEDELMLSVTVEDLGEVVTLRCLGRIVRGDETSLLCAAVQHLDRNIVLDLSKVEAIDAAGVGVLISLQAAGVYLKLINPTRQVREVLRVTGLESIFEVCETRLSDGTLVGVARGASATSCLPCKPEPPQTDGWPVSASN